MANFEFYPDVQLGQRVLIEPGAILVAPRKLSAGGDFDLVLKDDVVIGAGAIVAGAKVIGTGARVEPGAVVSQDVPAHAIVSGNPARVIGYSTPPGPDRTSSTPIQIMPPEQPGSVRLLGGAELFRFQEIVDLRGSLSFAQLGQGLPFVIKRFFCVYGVPSSELRGEHAHRSLHELLISVSGSVKVSLTNGNERQEVVLESPDVGLHIPPFVWSTQFQYQPNSVLLVMCSEGYDPESYIRDFDQYLTEVSPSI